MKSVIQRIILIILVVILLFLCSSFLTQCSMMYGYKDFASDNLNYHAHNIFNSCFVGCYTWPLNENYAVLNIPDTCDGYRVTALGGYIGSGGPCPFFVNLPSTVSIHSEGTLPDNARIERYHLVINIGKYLREDKLIMMDEYHKVGNDQFVQILVTVNCAPDNPFFYSKNGRLYRKSDNSLVEGFFYEADVRD